MDLSRVSAFYLSRHRGQLLVDHGLLQIEQRLVLLWLLFDLAEGIGDGL
jgi:hypothetical protein